MPSRVEFQEAREYFASGPGTTPAMLELRLASGRSARIRTCPSGPATDVHRVVQAGGPGRLYAAGTDEKGSILGREGLYSGHMVD